MNRRSVVSSVILGKSLSSLSLSLLCCSNRDDTVVKRLRKEAYGKMSGRGPSDPMWLWKVPRDGDCNCAWAQPATATEIRSAEPIGDSRQDSVACASATPGATEGKGISQTLTCLTPPSFWPLPLGLRQVVVFLFIYYLLVFLKPPFPPDCLGFFFF